MKINQFSGQQKRRMMRCRLLAFLSFAVGIPSMASTPSSHPIPSNTAKSYFAEAQSLCEADHGSLWGISLCGPIMFVDPESRFVVANQSDANGALIPESGVYMGTLPADEVIANTAHEWSGVQWTQMLWPLPSKQWQRKTLIAHELFHRIQDQLKLPTGDGGENAHLDTLDGRYYLQLEWRALARALGAQADAMKRNAAADALLFRSKRYRLFPDAARQEETLEINEGLAEYTGVMVGNRTADRRIMAALSDLTGHVEDTTYVRSFAYATGPAYGLLLDHFSPGWRQQLATGVGFDFLLGQALRFNETPNVDQAAYRQARLYGGGALRESEVRREDSRQRLLSHDIATYIDGPVLAIKFRNMQIQFDPRNLRPLGKSGTVYPTMKVSDDWGILEVKNGALLKGDWSGVIVAAPPNVQGSSINGDGWTLRLKPEWSIVAGNRGGDYELAGGS